MPKTALVTGGAGFIGSAVVDAILAATDWRVVTLDKLTYAGNLANLSDALRNRRHTFVKGDICDQELVGRLFREARPDAVMHLAAESHVDRSIVSPRNFVDTNVVGTYMLLEASRAHWSSLDGKDKTAFRFLHVSTDEVYGSLGPTGAFTPDSPYRPNSPYSASKAAADHFVRAWHRTYGLPTLISNCSNNYGPRQYPEKLIPLMIANAIAGKTLPIYGDGDQVRDWLHVDDHAAALLTLLDRGKVGETYCIGGDAEEVNRNVVNKICALLDEMMPNSPHCPHAQLIVSVADRPGHDKRYATDASKVRDELGWRPRRTFADGLQTTVKWYIDNQAWCQAVMDGGRSQ